MWDWVEEPAVVFELAADCAVSAMEEAKRQKDAATRATGRMDNLSGSKWSDDGAKTNGFLRFCGCEKRESLFLDGCSIQIRREEGWCEFGELFLCHPTAFGLDRGEICLAEDAIGRSYVPRKNNVMWLTAKAAP